jgi:hypothetical protein
VRRSTPQTHITPTQGRSEQKPPRRAAVVCLPFVLTEQTAAQGLKTVVIEQLTAGPRAHPFQRQFKRV